MDTDEHGFLKAMKMKIIIAFIIILGWQIGAQTVANTPSDLVNSNQNKFTPAEIAEMKAKGIDPRYATIIQPITNREGFLEFVREDKSAIYESGSWP